MVNKKEFRVGNLVQAPHGELPVAEVLRDALHFAPVRESPWIQVPYELIKGIPLTEEKLFSFGFQKIKDGLYTKGQFELWWVESRGFYHTEQPYPKTVAFVHQLQNLFFELSGE